MIDKGLLEADTAWARRVASNPGPFNGKRVVVVEPGTPVGGHVVTDTSAVHDRDNSTIHVTQSTWDRLVEESVSV